MSSSIIFLDNGATSYPKPEEVYAFMDSFYRRAGVNPGRSGYDLCLEAGEVLEGTRKQMTRFFNGTDPNRLCFGYNSTDALNLALWGLLDEGDHAVTTMVEHNSVLRPLYHLARDRKVELDIVPFDENGFVDPDEIEKRFKPNTKVVALNHASNVIGTIQPIRETGRRCRNRGIVFVADTSQSAGKIPVDMEADFIDVLCFTGHKSLLGPMGIGGLYVREGVEVRQTRAGGTGVRSAQKSHLEEYPYRMEFGTPNLPGIAGLHAGVKWIESKGLDAIHHQEMALAEKLVAGLREIPGVILYCLKDLRDHISVLSFNVEGMDASDVGTMLDVDHNIACRTGLHCAPLVHEHLGSDKLHGAVRFGIGPFNTEAHIDAAIKAVQEIASTRKR
ncbi:MAG: aminotransferase class V-fold PLP-dependent enzyme [Candidatus Aminicenantes bacterium]|nr:aminotransferase class V-fold PLP-dependent enzyme [Candidatus Aminicenantes bacterium]